jgi:hypothetical protein
MSRSSKKLRSAKTKLDEAVLAMEEAIYNLDAPKPGHSANVAEIYRILSNAIRKAQEKP